MVYHRSAHSVWHLLRLFRAAYLRGATIEVASVLAGEASIGRLRLRTFGLEERRYARRILTVGAKTISVRIIEKGEKEEAPTV